jgi:dihydrofolate reductase
VAKLLVSTLVTLDGTTADPQSWAPPYFDDDTVDRSIAVLRASSAMLMGRGTYDYLAPSWSVGEGAYMDTIRGIEKIVFSSRPLAVDWDNTTLVGGDAVAHVAALKQSSPADLVVYGYGALSRALVAAGLVDRVVFSVHPLWTPGARPFRTDRVTTSGTDVVTIALVPGPATDDPVETSP